MIKLVCYGSKTLHLKEACRSYVGEKRFTTIQILAAKEIDGHKLSDLQVDLHITQGLYNNKIPVAFSSDADMYQTDVILDEKYTLSAGKIGFYLQFNKTEPDSGNKIIGKTNAVFVEVSNNLSSDKHNKQNNSFDLGVSTGGSSGANGKDGKDGKDGITYTPSISTEGILTWVNDGGLPNPEPIKIVGANGKDGKDGSDIDFTDETVIKTLSEALKIKPHTADYLPPDDATVGELGELRMSIKTKKVYSCIDLADTENGIEYIWKELTNPEIITELSDDSTDEQVPSAKAVKSYVNSLIDSMNASLDELHSYAQAIVSGGDE